jgi:hypothetical protein
MPNPDLCTELSAMRDIASALDRLHQPTRARVLRWIVERFQDDAPFLVTSTPAIASTAVSEWDVLQTAHAVDESLSVGTLNDLFAPDAPTVAKEPVTQSVSGMLQELVAEFHDLAREWNGPDAAPVDRQSAEALVPVAS